MSRITELLDRRLYPTHTKNWDDALLRERILRRVRAEHHVLDFGAGRGLVAEMNLKGLAARVCGIDVDPAVAQNPMLDEAKLIDGKTIPYGDATFDLVISDNVLEHVEQPDGTFAEISRVLKPGGTFIAKTPNAWHYMPTIARVTPHWFHTAYNRARGRQSFDTFRTVYAANTPAKIRTLAARAGLTVEAIDLVEGRPEYLRLAAPLYVAGWLYERAVNAFDAFSRFRLVMYIELQKPVPA